MEEYDGLELSECEIYCRYDTRCEYFVHTKNTMNEDPMKCQLFDSKDATCDLEIGPSTPTKEEACSGM